MINVSDFEKIKERYNDYWLLKNKIPILSVTAPKSGTSYDYPPPESSKDYWFNTKYIVESNRMGNETAYFAGDSYPYVSPSLGPDIISAIMGLEINYNEASSWVKHLDCELSEIKNFNLDQNNYYLNKMSEIITAFCEDAKNGDYIVGMVDLNTLLDGVASLIGPENLCYSMYDEPEEVKRLLSEHLKLYKKVFTYYNDIIKKYGSGYTNWLGIYSEMPWYYISNDFMVMISDEFFEEFTLEQLREMASFHDRVMFHLDGEDATKHLNRILTVGDITGVQVQGKPLTHCAEFWIPYLKEIQNAGKVAMIDVASVEQMMLLVKNIEPEGLLIRSFAETQDQADEMVRIVNAYYK